VFDHVINTYEKEVVSIIVGKDVTEQEKEDILSYVNENHRYVEVGFIEGKQDIYSFIISFE
jgi:dihydroxyacetone kinase-like predicted kinase